MSQAKLLKATNRQGTLQAARAEGNVPAVLYGRGLKAESIQVNAKEFAKAFGETGFNTLVNLEVNGNSHNVLIREVQWHPLKDHATHIDFYQVRMDEKVRAEVPLTIVGESVAVKDLSGVLVRSLDSVELEALPQDLPHEIKVDISVLKDFDSVIHVSDLVLSAGVELINEPDEVVALVQAPRSDQEMEALSEEAKEDVESVEGIKKEESVAEEAAEEDKSDKKEKK